MMEMSVCIIRCLFSRLILGKTKSNIIHLSEIPCLDPFLFCFDKCLSYLSFVLTSVMCLWFNQCYSAFSLHKKQCWSPIFLDL